MSRPKKKSLGEVLSQGCRVLVEQLGAEDAVRFLQYQKRPHGNYTKERQKLFEGETVNSLVQQMKRMGKRPRPNRKTQPKSKVGV